MGNWDDKLLERVFSHFVKKIMDGEDVCQTVGDALIYISHAGKWKASQISCHP
jgi:hypothetical protein